MITDDAAECFRLLDDIHERISAMEREIREMRAKLRADMDLMDVAESYSDNEREGWE